MLRGVRPRAGRAGRRGFLERPQTNRHVPAAIGWSRRGKDALRSKSASALVRTPAGNSVRFTKIVSDKETSMSAAESFGRSAFAQFVNSGSGRLARFIAGVFLIAGAYALGDNVPRSVFIAVGLIPLATGAFDLCMISAIIG